MAGYMPLAFLRTRTYTAYQFLAYLRYDGRTAEECMRYAILTVMTWIRSKLGSGDLPEEFISPDSSDFMNATSEQFRSFHFREGINIDMTSLLSEGIWALHIQEPDSDKHQRRAVLGRFFITEVALRLEDDLVRFAVRVDVLDPVEVDTEVSYAFRPAFMREMFSNKKLRITQVDLLRYDEAYSVNNSHGLRHMLDVLESTDNYMPSIIFTYAEEKRRVLDLVETLDDAMNLQGTEASFRNHLSACSLVPELLEYGQPVLPYDVHYAARHSFGYGRVYLIEPNQFSAFQSHLGPDIHMGDVIWIEPVRYGGNSRVISYCSDDKPSVREKIMDDLLAQVHCFSKHKLYDFSSVVFEETARRKETENRIHGMLDALRQNNQEKTDELYHETEQLLGLYDQEKNQMQEEINRLRRDVSQLNGKITYLDSRLGKAKGNGSLRLPEIKEFYPDEQHDLVITMLQHALSSCCQEGSRAYELLNGILSVNELSGEGKELFEKIKQILYRNNNITENDEQDLRKLGFTVTKRGNGHYKLVFQGDERYTFTLSGTAGDVRSMKNAYAEIDGKLSVYK